MQRPQTLAVRYASQREAGALLANPDQLLGVIGYGAARPDLLPAPCPFMAAPLLPSAGDAAYEIWTAGAPTRPCQFGPVIGACSDDLAFGMIWLEAGEAPLEAMVEQAYLDIFAFLDHTGCNEPIRFWNYLAGITEDEHGLERYRRFNIGRHRAFMAKLQQPVPPAASCLGTCQGGSMIYFLAARDAAKAIENPRQISAYDYPPQYGPRSPSFSRAGLHGKNESATFFISGTASIVGHETQHHGDLQGQIAETIENLRALITQAGPALQHAQPEDWALKIYLRNPFDQTAVETALTAAFGPATQRLYLHAEICRRDLLVEIEALHHATATVLA